VALLDGIAPPRLAAHVARRAEELTGAPTGLYLIELAGHELVRVAGSAQLPERFEVGPVLGSELPRSFPAPVVDRVREQIDAHVRPLWHAGRAFVVLVSEGSLDGLDDLVSEAAPAFDLAQQRTDVFDRARRREETTAAAELQVDLLPPPLAQVPGAQLAGAILPAYSVGGDWFDWADNDEEVRFSVADVAGSGDEAMAVAAVALSSLRASRRNGNGLERTADAVHATVSGLAGGRFVTGLLCRYAPESRDLTWINCGHLDPLVVDAAGAVRELEGPRHPPLGVEEGAPFACQRVRLEPGDRLVLVTDGVTERRRADGSRVDVDGLKEILATIGPGAARTVIELLRAIEEASPDPVGDDATVLVLGVEG
jgi:serine phosphatase RsbU (regulator of sigma subunit)